MQLFVVFLRPNLLWEETVPAVGGDEGGRGGPWAMQSELQTQELIDAHCCCCKTQGTVVSIAQPAGMCHLTHDLLLPSPTCIGGIRK